MRLSFWKDNNNNKNKHKVKIVYSDVPIVK